jgi:hypothetical protein
VQFLVSNDNNSLFSGQPAVSPGGTLTYTPAANANGSATITLKITDDGGTANGGVNQSATQSFTITVTAVNDAPTIDGVASQAMLTGTTKTVGLTGISEGPANESSQTLSFSFASSNPSVATAALTGPYVESSGSASMLISAGAATCGSTTITVTVTDNGGTANGGDNDTRVSFTVSTFHGHFLAPLKEGARNLVQKGQVVPVKIDFGCPGSMAGLTPSIQLMKGDYTSDPESGLTLIDPTVSVSAADTTGFMRAADGKYMYNLSIPKTNDMIAGTELTIRVRPLATQADPLFGPQMQIVIEIRK